MFFYNRWYHSTFHKWIYYYYLLGTSDMLLTEILMNERVAASIAGHLWSDVVEVILEEAF